MPGPSAVVVRFPDDVRAELTTIVRSPSSPQGLVRRARIALLASDGWSNMAIAKEVGADVKTVRLWRGRVANLPTVEALYDLQRSGRPPSVSPAVRAELIRLACERVDADDKRPMRVVWSHAALRLALWHETDVLLSTSEIGRILRARELRPHRVRMWLNSQDPDFRAKVDRICPYYVDPPDDVTVLCVDEKRLFAHQRRPDLRPARPNEACRVEFEYSRHGSSVLLAAFDVKTGEVYGECRDRRTGEDLVEFMEAVAARVDGKVVVIWDNLNVHKDGKPKRWTEFNQRHGGRFEFVYTPFHASWVNQVEIWFSILERRALRYRSFPSVADVNAHVERFIDRWNEEEAHPFRWTFRGTRDWNRASWVRRSACSTSRLLGRRQSAAKAA